MTHDIQNTQEIKIAYIGGGSKGWAWGFMSDLAKDKQLSGTVSLYDINHDAARRNVIIGNSIYKDNPQLSNWIYTYTESLEEALTGADFVILSILPGTFDQMEIDVHTCEEYGIYQSVGDTVGPGGLMRAIRTVPQYEVIANAIKSYSPDAWVLNFTNPMSICTQTLYNIYPEIKAFGTQELLTKVLEETTGIANVKREDIEVDVYGINHFTWITSAKYKDIDLMDHYRSFVDRYYDTGYEIGDTGHWMNDHFSSANRVKFDLFKRYGIIAAAGDRHLAEFCPGQWYLKSQTMIEDWKFSLTPVSWRKENEMMLLEKASRLVRNEEAFELKETGEEGVKQIKALLGLSDLTTNVNLPNNGQIPNLPLGTIVETNAVFSKDSVIPLPTLPILEPIKSIMLRHIDNQHNIIQAALTHDKSLAYQTFINDPLVSMTLTDSKNVLKRCILILLVLNKSIKKGKSQF